MTTTWNELYAQRQERLEFLKTKSSFYYDSRKSNVSVESTQNQNLSQTDSVVANNVKLFEHEQEDTEKITSLPVPDEVKDFALQLRSQLSELDRKTEQAIKRNVQKKILQQENK